MKTKIYALRENGFVRYVGKTIKPLEIRLAEHIKGARKGEHTHKGYWIHSLLEKGLAPTITVLEMANGNGNKEEIAWIAYFRSYGIDLVNGTIGGDGVMAGRHHTEATKRKISLAGKGRKLSEETREKMRHRVFTREEIEKRIATRKARGYRCSEITKRKIGMANRGRIVSEATRQKLREVCRGFTDEDRRKAVITIKSRPFSLAHRRKISEAKRRRDAIRRGEIQ